MDNLNNSELFNFSSFHPQRFTYLSTVFDKCGGVPRIINEICLKQRDIAGNDILRHGGNVFVVQKGEIEVSLNKPAPSGY